jgi:hypothetical protein
MLVSEGTAREGVLESFRLTAGLALLKVEIVAGDLKVFGYPSSSKVWTGAEHSCAVFLDVEVRAENLKLPKSEKRYAIAWIPTNARLNAK